MDLQDALSGPVDRYRTLFEQIGEFALVTLVLYLLARFVLDPTGRWLLHRRGFDRTLERAIEKTLRGVWVVGATALGAWASGFTGLLGGSALFVAAVTLAVGFAAQDVLSNFVAGIFIVQDPNFNIDDWIEWDGRAGFIEDIGFRVTRVRTFDNETITVPNTDLATTAVTNRMSNEQLRISYGFGIGYDNDLEEASRICLESAAADADILEDPEPTVRLADLDDAAIVLQARFWIADPDREEFSEIRSRYIRTVIDRCRKAGIELSTTTQLELSGALCVEDGSASSEP